LPSSGSEGTGFGWLRIAGVVFGGIGLRIPWFGAFVLTGVGLAGLTAPGIVFGGVTFGIIAF
jgi:hypothetical protein